MCRLLVFATVVVLANLAAPPAANADQAAAAGTAHPGAKIYAAQKSSMCHSIAGVGNKKRTLDGVGAKLTTDRVAAGYWYEDYKTEDFALGPLTISDIALPPVQPGFPIVPTNSLLLGYLYRPYTAHTGMVRLTYLW